MQAQTLNKNLPYVKRSSRHVIHTHPIRYPHDVPRTLSCRKRRLRISTSPKKVMGQSFTQVLEQILFPSHGGLLVQFSCWVFTRILTGTDWTFSCATRTPYRTTKWVFKLQPCAKSHLLPPSTSFIIRYWCLFGFS